MRILRSERVDVLHAHLFEPATVGLSAAALARTPLRVLTRHYSDYHTRIGRNVHVTIDRVCTRLSHRVVAVSQHTADHLLSREAAPACKIRVVLNGIDFDRVQPSGPNARARVRATEGLGDMPALLIAARLHPEKGYEYLLDAMPILRSKITRPFILLVAGGGALEPYYRERVRQLGCQDLVRFLGFRRDLPDLMVASDLVVLPSVAEAFGLVLAEALYLGVPVVASRVGGIPEIVDDGVDGLLVPPADSSALAAALADLLLDPARRARLAGEGRGKVLRRFRFEDMVRAYEALYDEALAESIETA
jgi:glycosyltransferase involved in cell wall biosynthesis